MIDRDMLVSGNGYKRTSARIENQTAIDFFRVHRSDPEITCLAKIHRRENTDVTLGFQQLKEEWTKHLPTSMASDRSWYPSHLSTLMALNNMGYCWM
jgi:hypothetical protein